MSRRTLAPSLCLAVALALLGINNQTKTWNQADSLCLSCAHTIVASGCRNRAERSAFLLPTSRDSEGDGGGDGEGSAMLQMRHVHLEDTALSLRKRFETDCTLGARWRMGQLRALREMLVDNNDLFCQALNEDLGKSNDESNHTELLQLLGEIDEAIASLHAWMSPELGIPSLANMGGITCITKEPMGAVLIISAWNYPLYLLLNPLVGAISAGNVACLKPSEYAPATANVTQRLVGKYLDPSCFGVVLGGETETKALLAQRWDKVFFTGSTRVGRSVLQASSANLTPCVLELGGKCPAVIDQSANVECAARRIVWGSFALNSGQTCVRPDYVLCHAGVYKKFVACLRSEITSQFGGDAHGSGDYSRIVASHPSHFRLLSETIMACSDYIVAGGDVNEAENYISPTVLGFEGDCDAFETSQCMNRELFGPILPVLAVPSLDEACDMVRRRNEHPLAAYLFTASRSSRSKFGSVQAGGIAINECVLHMTECGLPFGGRGASGMGSYHGRHGFEAFSHSKSALYKWDVTSVEFMRYGPMTPLKRLLMRLILAKGNVVKHAFQSLRFGAQASFLLGGVYATRGGHWAVTWGAVVLARLLSIWFEKVFHAFAVWWLTGR